MIIEAKSKNNANKQVEFNTKSDLCPHCHTKIDAQPIYADYRAIDPKLIVVFRCPNDECLELFKCYYNLGASGSYYLVKTSKGTVEPINFSSHIKGVSEAFCSIFSQAHEAEEMGLEMIVGPGYRKALEFLIKDYLISKFPDDATDIAATFLGVCIDKYIKSKKIKDVAKRAVWLGNDETHYERRWGDKDLKNMKSFIELTVNWIKEAIVYQKMMDEMPDPKDQEKSVK